MELGSAQLKKRFLHTLESPGLSHVRILSILSLSEAQVNILCRLIFALPKNALTRFEYVHSSLPTVSMHLLTRYRIPTFYLSSVGIQCALRLRQKKLSSYRYGGEIDVDSTRRPLIWRALAPSGSELAHITTLQILMVDMSDIERMAWILQHTIALQHLDLEEHLGYCDSHSHSHLTCCAIDAEIFTRLFGSFSNARYPARLKTLRIASMCLEQSGELLTSLLNLEDLETLQLVECNEIGSFIEHLTQLQSNVSSLCINRGSDGPRDGAAISAFIASLAELKRLSLLCEVDQPYDGQIDVGCLRKHAQSIEYLRLEDNNITWLTNENSDQAPQFCTFFNHASNLKQLALSGPVIDDEKEVDEFLVSVHYITQSCSSRLTINQNILQPLTALNVLKTEMFIEEGDVLNPNIPFVERLVEKTANKIFNTAFPQLAAVVIKVSGLPSKVFEDRIFAFLRSEQVGSDGGKLFVAVKIEPHMIKHHVACADILEEERFTYA
jgi:hypothetical protein